MNLPQVYMCSPPWTLLPPLSPYHPSGSSQCTSPKHPVSCIEPGLATSFMYYIIHVSMPFSQIFPPSPPPTESIRLFYTSVSLLLSCTQGYCYHLSKFHAFPAWLQACISLRELSVCVSSVSGYIGDVKSKNILEKEVIWHVRIKGWNRELPFYFKLLRMLEVQMATWVSVRKSLVFVEVGP